MFSFVKRFFVKEKERLFQETFDLHVSFFVKECLYVVSNKKLKKAIGEGQLVMDVKAFLMNYLCKVSDLERKKLGLLKYNETVSDLTSVYRDRLMLYVCNNKHKTKVD